MKSAIRVNLANPIELREIPGIGPAEVEAILKFRQEHGPIQDLGQLSRILDGRALMAEMAELVDFTPADDSAPEAPGA